MEPSESEDEGNGEVFHGYGVPVLQDETISEDCSHNNVSGQLDARRLMESLGAKSHHGLKP